jgi:hypothetical protein
MERFKFKKLNGIEGKEQFHVKVTNKYKALETLYTSGY